MAGRSALNDSAPIEQERRVRARDLYLILIVAIAIALIAVITIKLSLATEGHPRSGWINPFDVGIERFLNHLVLRSTGLALAAGLFAHHNLTKGAVILCLYWAAFFSASRSDEERLRRYAYLAANVPLSFISLAVTRALADTLPFRTRPLATPSLHLALPHQPYLDSFLQNWQSSTSSFPSDHAALFMTLAVGIWLASRREGTIAVLYTIFFIILPRPLLGVHWPTDVIAGSLIGTAVALIALIPAFREFTFRVVEAWWRRWPATLAAAAFLFSYEICELFHGPITIIGVVLKHRL